VDVYEKRELIFVAKVKNGFVPRIRDELFPALKALQTPKCSFRNLPEKRASRWGESLTAEKMDQCRWVTPKLVCQVAFVEWTDARHLRHCPFRHCLRILGHCRRAMNSGSRLLIIEMVLPAGDTPHPGKMVDMMMLVGPGGQERTEHEYTTLLDKAGLRLTRVVPTESPVSVLEAALA
jgi:O-methyltransferase domain/ATP dependent DNA ligase C terminal region